MSFKRHKIFASGVHRKNNPEEAVWPAERVHKLFERTQKFSPALIPYTYRHPENGLPVLGWAEKSSVQLAEESGKTYLSAVPKELAVEFMQGLKDVGYDQVSIGLGKMGEIVHIGITDKERTAVAGLGPVFERSETVPAVYAEEVTFEAADLGGGLDSSFEVSWKWQLQSWMSDVASLFQRMRDQKIETDGLEAADKFLPSYVVDFLKRDLPADDRQAEPEALLNYESDGDMTAEQKAEFDRLKAFEQEQLQKAAGVLVQSRKDAVTRFCADHVEIVTDKIKPQVEALLAALQLVEEPATFEAAGETVSKSAFELGCELIAGMPKAVSFERDVAGTGSGPGAEEDKRPLSQQADAATAEKIASLGK